ncbi:MAG: OmpH family outer membrane protein [Bacteroidota bacterium]
MISTSRILPTLTLVCSALFFFGCQPQESGGTNTEAAGAAAGAGTGLKVVYIRLDSLQSGYTELATELGRLEDNAAKAQENIQKQVAALEQEVRRLQNQMQQGLLAPNKVQSEQQRIARKEQQIMQQRDLALGSIQEDQLRLNAEFGERVKDILETLREEKGYDFILNEGGGSGLLMANDAYDITNLVLERLNADDASGMDQDSVQ